MAAPGTLVTPTDAIIRAKYTQAGRGQGVYMTNAATAVYDTNSIVVAENW